MPFFSQKSRRRKQASQPVSDSFERIIRHNFIYDRLLDADERQRLRGMAQVIIAEKYWEACGGQAINEEVQVTIAAQAALLLLGMEHDFFPNVQSILVYPGAYVQQQRDMWSQGPTSDSSSNLGEAWFRGPVVLSWADAKQNGQHLGTGHNLVIHEFAHKLDMLSGYVDGTPPQRKKEDYQRWHQVMTEAFQQLCRAVEQGRQTVLRPYGATNVGEFFAVCTEAFFFNPIAMQSQHSDLYDVMRVYYGQDTAERFKRVAWHRS
ncbi:MAG: M90 family metallopeptidase [Phycisphaerales bacterium]|nr:M90 family metallopeptidase [Phycisphaerales bacterium]